MICGKRMNSEKLSSYPNHQITGLYLQRTRQPSDIKKVGEEKSLVGLQHQFQSYPDLEETDKGL